MLGAIILAANSTDGNTDYSQKQSITTFVLLVIDPSDPKYDNANITLLVLLCVAGVVWYL
jgi:hypothetical protein